MFITEICNSNSTSFFVAEVSSMKSCKVSIPNELILGASHRSKRAHFENEQSFDLKQITLGEHNVCRASYLKIDISFLICLIK